MNVLKTTLDYRETLKKLINSNGADGIKKASQVSLEIPHFDIDNSIVKGMTHTALSSGAIYNTSINIKDRTVRCDCMAGKTKRICKHTIRLAQWLDQRLEMDQKAIEQALNSSLIGSWEIQKLLAKAQAAK